jgi:radical SAM protein with 4Fe4S-binding SPASM domain
MIGDEFSHEEIEAAARSGRLLSMEIEFSLACNFRCRYCYVASGTPPPGELTVAEIRDIVRQAKALGARKIIVLGGEPMVYPHTLEMLEFVHGEGLAAEMFTNGTNVTEDAARRLFAWGTTVALKMNTRRPELQDFLSGRAGAYDIIQTAFRNLRQAGYPAPGRILAVSTVICRQNADELVDLWAWLRDQGITPYFEIITPQGRARENDGLSVDNATTQRLFERMAQLDRTRYGRAWDPQPPLVGSRCLRHQFSCLVSSQGVVKPCVGVTIGLGNVREKPLREILLDSEVVQDLRNYRRTMRGPCRTCDKAAECYGCRGAAYQLTGDYLGSDPLCWRNTGRLAEILHLPAPVDGLIPQHAPMRLVDTLVSVGERAAVIEATIRPDGPFTNTDGTLEEAAFLEIMAQSMAALNGFRTIRNGDSPQGFLLGARQIEVVGSARVGDRLTVTVQKHAKYGDFGLVLGRVSRNGELLARGEIKVWHKTDATTAPPGDLTQSPAGRTA